MVDTIKELEGLSRRLNQSSDKINEIISGINKNLASLNIGIEAWDENNSLVDDDFNKADLPREKRVVYLGYRKVDDHWQLAIKDATLVEENDQEFEGVFTELVNVRYVPLLKASREIRVGALALIPRLLDAAEKFASEQLLFDERGKVVPTLDAMASVEAEHPNKSNGEKYRLAEARTILTWARKPRAGEKTPRRFARRPLLPPST